MSESEQAREILNQIGDGMERIWPQLVQWTRIESLFGFIFCVVVFFAVRFGWRFSVKERDSGDIGLCYGVRALCAIGAFIFLVFFAVSVRDLLYPEIGALKSLIPGK